MAKTKLIGLAALPRAERARICAKGGRANKGRKPWNAGTGKGWTDKRGYRWVYITRDGRRTAMREHRLIMQNHLGRPLEPWELVHHKDGDTSNNALDNLQLSTWPAHNRLHHKGTRRDKALQDAVAAFAQMRWELKREREIKAELLKALRDMVVEFDTQDPTKREAEVYDAAVAAIALAESGKGAQG